MGKHIVQEILEHAGMKTIPYGGKHCLGVCEDLQAVGAALIEGAVYMACDQTEEIAEAFKTADCDTIDSRTTAVFFPLIRFVYGEIDNG